MWIARLFHKDYLIGSSRINFRQETLISALNGLNDGDINHSSELYSNFITFVSVSY